MPLTTWISKDNHRLNIKRSRLFGSGNVFSVHSPLSLGEGWGEAPIDPMRLSE